MEIKLDEHGQPISIRGRTGIPRIGSGLPTRSESEVVRGNLQSRADALQRQYEGLMVQKKDPRTGEMVKVMPEDDRTQQLAKSITARYEDLKTAAELEVTRAKQRDAAAGLPGADEDGAVYSASFSATGGESITPMA